MFQEYGMDPYAPPEEIEIDGPVEDDLDEFGD